MQALAIPCSCKRPGASLVRVEQVNVAVNRPIEYDGFFAASFLGAQVSGSFCSTFIKLGLAIQANPKPPKKANGVTTPRHHTQANEQNTFPL